MKKSFFIKRTAEEIRQMSEISRVYRQKGLVDKIWNLNPETQALELRTPIIPLSFLAHSTSNAAASRKDYKHGELILVDQPTTQKEAYESPSIPLSARMRALDNALHNKKEEEINYLGITWQPIQGNDRRWRVVPFDALLEGVKIYDYSVHRTNGIEVIDKYTDAEIVKREGGQILCRVPSRTKSKERYAINLMNVPLVHGKEANAVVWGLKSQYEEGKEPKRTTFLHNLRYEFSSGRKGSDIFVFGPHDIAAYLAVVREYFDTLENTVPLIMNPFPLPSKAYAQYGDKIDNNVVIYDPTLQSKDKLRNLHLDEKCILLARAIKVKGSWDTVFWNPQRDGPIKNYWR